MSKLIGRIVLVSALAIAGGVVDAEDARKLPKIGQVFGTNPAVAKPYDEAFRQGLRSLGYVDGENVTILPRYAHGEPARTSAAVSELIALKVDVLVVAHTAIPAAMQATRTIPVVCPTMDDPVVAGFAASFARPGGNLTGLYGLWAETDRKVLEVAMEIMPSLRRAGAMFEATDASSVAMAKTLRTLALDRGVAIRPFAVHNLDEIEAALAVVDRDRLQALFLYGTPLTYLHRNRIMALASRKVPVISDGRDFADAGALLTYGASIRDMWRRGAVYVDKILKGAKPGDLPIEQPTKFDMIINLKTAKRFGITTPESILLRADEIIQ